MIGQVVALAVATVTILPTLLLWAVRGSQREAARQRAAGEL